MKKTTMSEKKKTHSSTSSHNDSERSRPIGARPGDETLHRGKRRESRNRRTKRRSPNRKTQKTRRISHEWRRRIQEEDRRRNAEAAAQAPCASTHQAVRPGQTGEQQRAAAEQRRRRSESEANVHDANRRMRKQKHVLPTLQSGMEKRGTGVTEGRRRRRHAEGENAMHPSMSTDR